MIANVQSRETRFLCFLFFLHVVAVVLIDLRTINKHANVANSIKAVILSFRKRAQDCGFGKALAK